MRSLKQKRERIRELFRDIREYELNLKYQLPREFLRYRRRLEVLCGL